MCANGTGAGGAHPQQRPTLLCHASPRCAAVCHCHPQQLLQSQLLDLAAEVALVPGSSGAYVLPRVGSLRQFAWYGQQHVPCMGGSAEVQQPFDLKAGGEACGNAAVNT